MAARGGVRKGEDGSLLAQVRNHLAIWDISDGDIRDVMQVLAENLLVMAGHFLDAASYVRRDRRCCSGGQWLLSGQLYSSWWTNMVLALKSLTFVSL